MKNNYFLRGWTKRFALLTVCIGFNTAMAQNSTGIVSNDTDIPIPDNGDWISTSLDVSGIPEDHHIFYIETAFQANHTWVGDLKAFLTEPGDNGTGLFHRPGVPATSFGNSANLSGGLIIFNDYAANSSETIGQGLGTDDNIPGGSFYTSWDNTDDVVPSYDGLIDMAQNFSGSKNGEWLFWIRDNQGGDTGTLLYADVIIRYDRYCVPFLNNNYEHITNVTFAGINSDTDENEYRYPDYNTVVWAGTTPATVSQGETYPLSVTIDAAGAEYIYAFFDWNQDGDFDDAGEIYTVVSNTSSDGPHTINIDVPATALTGETRMRVMLAWDQNAPDPCGDFTYGETEDYTVIVDNLGVSDMIAKAKITVYPNPAVDVVNFDSQNTIEEVILYDTTGREVMAKTANAEELQLNVSALPSGVYMVKIKTSEGTESIKVVKR